MASPKTLKRYTTQWLALLDEFKDNPDKVVVMQCPDKNKAMGMRLEFYKMREVLLKEPDFEKEYEEALNSREVRVTEDGKVIFDSKENNWIGKIIEKSLHPQTDEGERNE